MLFRTTCETGTAGVSELMPTGCLSLFCWNCSEFQLICIRIEANFMTFPQTCRSFIGAAACVCVCVRLGRYINYRQYCAMEVVLMEPSVRATDV